MTLWEVPGEVSPNILTGHAYRLNPTPPLHKSAAPRPKAGVIKSSKSLQPENH